MARSRQHWGGGGTNYLPNERLGFTEWAERGGSFTSVLANGVNGSQKFGLVSSIWAEQGATADLEGLFHAPGPLQTQKRYIVPVNVE